MLKAELAAILERDLRKVKEEIAAYPDENMLWQVGKNINNSEGNLCLHLIGNLNHFIGATLGSSGYVRERDKEFSNKNIPKQELLHALDHTISVVKNTLEKLSEDDLDKNFPLEKQGQIVTTQYILLHLITHLSYHLGQINYHRRLLA